MRPSSNLPALIERYFTVRLMNERNASRQHDRMLSRLVPAAVHVRTEEATHAAVGFGPR